MKTKQQSLLWSIQKEGHQKPSFLLGTVHAKSEQAFHIQALAQTKILQCDFFATEIDLDKAQSYNMMQSLQLPENQQLNQLLSEKKYRTLEALLLKNANLPLASFNHLPPIFVCSLLASSIMASDYPLSLDEAFWHFAKENGKQCIGIEDLEEHFSVLKKIAIPQQLKMLTDILKNFTKFRKKTLRLGELYEKEDLNNLYKNAKKARKASEKS